jgi:hypothetical protein
MVMDGTLPTDISIRLVQLKKRLGHDGANQAAIARALLDHPDEDFSEAGAENGKKGKRTGASIARERRKRLLTGATSIDDADARSFILDEAVLRVHSRLTQVLGPLRGLEGFKESEVLEGMRRKAYPIEVTLELAEEAEKLLARLKEQIMLAISPESLPEYPGKPSFVEFIDGKAASFALDLRFRIARLLSEASDKKTEHFTSAEIARTLDIDTVNVRNNLGYLKDELEAIGLVLLEGKKRIREGGQRGNLGKIPAYRLDWKKEEELPPPVHVPEPIVVTRPRPIAQPVVSSLAPAPK